LTYIASSVSSPAIIALLMSTLNTAQYADSRKDASMIT
jgi:hypothetical protein